MKNSITWTFTTELLGVTITIRLHLLRHPPREGLGNGHQINEKKFAVKAITGTVNQEAKSKRILCLGVLSTQWQLPSSLPTLMGRKNTSLTSQLLVRNTAFSNPIFGKSLWGSASNIKDSRRGLRNGVKI
jgi:hypothetical protein